jgi:glycosyltransferase involved in cell wall biosynthesis
MKLIVNIGTDYHLNCLIHFLKHYTDIGVELFLCGIHGNHLDKARRILANYPVEIVACFGDVRFDEVSSRYWKDNFNAIRRQHVRPDEWCLYADVDEFHEYPPGFFAELDPQINAVRGKWIERLATHDGQFRPCLPEGNIGQQYPYGTREIFCGISQKIMAARGDLEVVFGYHWITGGSDKPVYYKKWLNVHHFRWDDLAPAKYQSRKWTRHFNLAKGHVPNLNGVFYADPPFPVDDSTDGHNQSTPKFSVIILAHNAETSIGQTIESIQAQTFHDWELIIVDGGSTDNTQTVIAQYIHRDDRIKVDVQNNNDGLTKARQRGFALAQGDYVYCLEANYRSLPSTLQRLYEQFVAYPEAALVYGAVLGMNQNASPINVLSWLAKDNFLNVGAVAMKLRPLTEEISVPETALTDQELWWLLVANNPVTFVAGSPLSHYRLPNSPDFTTAHGSLTHTTISSSLTGTASQIKLAYLILAHNQPHHLARLVQALNHENAYFFIHIDKKVDSAPFKQLIPSGNNITFISNRVKVYWGGLSVVKATLNLMKAAVKAGPDFKYYTLLSGSDYPSKNKHEIYEQLQSSDKQFIRIDRKLNGEPRTGYFYKVEKYHLWQDSCFFNARTHHRFMDIRQRIQGQVNRLIDKYLPKRSGYGNMTPYHGSMYWSLTGECVQFILTFLKKDPGYIRFHKFVHAPDEIFFHTIVKHSPFAEAISQDFAEGIYPDHLLHGNHFIDWQGLRKRHNLTLDERDIDDLLLSDALFARKFDEKRSDKLLDMLDEQIHYAKVQAQAGGCKL